MKKFHAGSLLFLSLFLGRIRCFQACSWNISHLLKFVPEMFLMHLSLFIEKVSDYFKLIPGMFQMLLSLFLGRIRCFQFCSWNALHVFEGDVLAIFHVNTICSFCRIFKFDVLERYVPDFVTRFVKAADEY